MATFKIVLDKRVPLKDGRYNLAIRVVDNKDVLFLNLQKLTQQQYNVVFRDNSMDEQHIAFREKCNDFLTKAERIFSQLKCIDRDKFRQMFFNNDLNSVSTDSTLLVSDLVERYIEETITNTKTKDTYRIASRSFNSFKSGLTIADITPRFLQSFEQHHREKGNSLATVFSYNRSLRAVIRYFMNEEKVISKSYKYPYGRGRYSIGSYFPQKQVITLDEIQRVLNFKNFDRRDPEVKALMKTNPLIQQMSVRDLEYARDIWALLYNMNGMNIGDLLWLRKEDIGDKFIHYHRRKTLKTRKNNIKAITIPVSNELKRLMKNVEATDSEYLLGLVESDYTDNTYQNKLRKVRRKINHRLDLISQYLELSVPLKMETARDTYATTLLRKDITKDKISTMLGHSNSVVTEHYLSTIDLEKTTDINSVLPTAELSDEENIPVEILNGNDGLRYCKLEG